MMLVLVLFEQKSVLLVVEEESISSIRKSYSLPSLDCRWICDGRAELLTTLVEQYPSAKPTSQLSDVLNDPEVEGCFVVVPATAHFDVVMQCLAAGKHVLVEKPLTVTSDLAGKIIQEQQATGLAVLVGHTYLYNATVRYVHRILHDNTLDHSVGKLHTIYARRTNLGPPKPDGTLPDRDVRRSRCDSLRTCVLEG